MSKKEQQCSTARHTHENKVAFVRCAWMCGRHGPKQRRNLLMCTCTDDVASDSIAVCTYVRAARAGVRRIFPRLIIKFRRARIAAVQCTSAGTRGLPPRRTDAAAVAVAFPIIDFSPVGRHGWTPPIDRAAAYVVASISWTRAF